MFILFEKPNLNKKTVNPSLPKNLKSNLELRALVEIAFQFSSYKDLCNLSLVNKKAFNHLSKILINVTLPNGTRFFRKSLAHCHRAVMDKRKYYDRSFYSSKERVLIGLTALLLILFTLGYGAAANISLYNRIKPEGVFASSFTAFNFLVGYLLTQLIILEVVNAAGPKIEDYYRKHFFNMCSRFLADLPIEFAESLEDNLNRLPTIMSCTKK